MIISGIQKTTLLDYPGKITTLIFTAGCNMRCKYCHNSDFVLPKKIKQIKDFIPEEIFFNFLKTKIGLIDGIVICGGEPTLQKGLKEFCKKVKDLGFLVKLDTNGQNPLILNELLKEKLLDYISMDIKGDYENLDNLIGISIEKEKYFESIQVVKDSNIDYEFRTTLIKNYHFINNFEKIVKQISGAKKYYLQNFKNSGNILDENFAGESFFENELLEFKLIAEKYVEYCQVRI